MTTAQELADSLDGLAAALEAGPIHIVGSYIEVQGGGGGSVIGKHISVQAGPPGTVTIGESISVSSSDYQARASELASEVRQAAIQLRAQGSAPRAWIEGLAKRVGGLGNIAISAVVSETAKKIAQFFMGQ